MTESFDDPIIREVREARAKLVEEAEAEGKSLVEFIREAQRREGWKVVSRPPRKIVRSKTG